MSATTVHLYGTLKVSFDGHVALVTLNRPKALNALNHALVVELDEVLHEITERPDTRVVIVTGAGTKAFAAGADIGEMANLDAQQATHFAEVGQRVFARLESYHLPVIAAVNGFALGGGCELAMACDIIVASSTAVFGQPEVRLGVIPGFGGTQRLTRLVGRQLAREITFTGRRVKAPEALRIGLVARVVEGDVVEAAMELAGKIGANGPRAVSLAKRAINTGADVDLTTAMAHEAQLFGLCFATRDQKEGMAAFLEKRPAKFEGK